MGSAAAGDVEDKKPPAAAGYDDLTYAEIDGRERQLDLRMPPNKTRPPLVVYIHGGSWRAGSTSVVP